MTPWYRSVGVGVMLALVGSVLFWAGLPWPVVADFFDADGEEAAQVAIVEDNRVQFAAAFGLLGLGATVAAVGLWVMGQAIAPFETETRGPRRGMAAEAAAWLGGAGALAGIARLSTALFATPEFAVDGGWINVAVGIVGWIGTSLALIIFGWLGLQAPPPNWACIVLIFGGVAGLVTFLPLFWYVALIVFSIPTVVQMRHTRPAGA